MKMMTKFVLDLFYPNRCPCCNDFIRWDKLICGKCHRAIEIVYDRTCHRCGKEICICSEKPEYDGAVVPLRYSDLTKEGILSLKRGNNKNFGVYTGKLIAQILAHDYPEKKFDFIVPVPMSRHSLGERGYNQAQIIAEQISEALHISVKNGILYKKNSQTSQHFLGRAQRFKNISSFGINKTDLSGKEILLCDDIITTGSTVNRCACLLRSEGAAGVFLAAAAQSKLK